MDRQGVEPLKGGRGGECVHFPPSKFTPVSKLLFCSIYCSDALHIFCVFNSLLSKNKELRDSEI